MYACELDIHGVRLRVKARGPERMLGLKSLCSLFVLPDRPEPDTDGEWIDGEELDILYFLARHDMLAFHAAAYENRNGVGVLLPGKGASGKTTIAYSALSSGYPFIGDDVVLCRGEGKDFNLLPFKNHLSLKGNGHDHIDEVLEHHPRDVFCSTRARVIVFPQIVRDERSAIVNLDDRKKIFRKLLENTVWVRDHAVRERQVSVLEKLCTLPAYDLFLGNDHRRRPQIAVEFLDGISVCSR